ncbi:molybdopterin-synthase adenylyltransferase MoeB [Porifericola rhodea]|uniref:molybdopterin-synthase adenylyltransferase MoeB n=1 Tax=Porifericola rhodea TaxID=930972 RepID=UPI002666692B|nr:molybdopterin-synthase adenylyltransferase MoeB [Porifericola rhodea]WKN30523.1 molybdopterin-synthase adenylyltransferase MoeB [Porifericola rhodea]
MLTKEELARYNRHIIIPEFNLEGQEKLKAAKVLVVGCGGLGAPLLSYLVAAGVGTIGIVDFDVVDKSNLHRQVLFSLEDVGKSKVETAAKKLNAQNPHVNIIAHNLRLTAENALDIIKDYDIVADGTDNFPTRYLVNDACVLLNKVNVHASIYRFEGQLSVFNYTDKNGVIGPNYRDLFPEPPAPNTVPSCAEGGVLGVLPGIMGSLQANEVIKVITGLGEPLSAKLFILDTLSFQNTTLKFSANPENPLSGDNPTQTTLIDYEEFCGLKAQNDEVEEEITAIKLKEMISEKEDFQLIDVRNAFEYEIANLGGELIPLNTLHDAYEKISRDKKVVVHCKGGQRSKQAIQILKEEYGYTNLLNLKGGIMAWIKDVDPEMSTY